jgi:hypothetical protein
LWPRVAIVSSHWAPSPASAVNDAIRASTSSGASLSVLFRAMIVGRPERCTMPPTRSSSARGGAEASTTQTTTSASGIASRATLTM